jgi:hypothetical protein
MQNPIIKIIKICYIVGSNYIIIIIIIIIINDSTALFSWTEDQPVATPLRTHTQDNTKRIIAHTYPCLQ